MKKGCAVGFSIGCFGIIAIIFFALILFDLLSDISFDAFEESSSDYEFGEDSLSHERIIISDYKWKFTSASLGRKNYSIKFNLLEKDVKDALKFMDDLSYLSANRLGVDTELEYENPILYTKLIWHEVYIRLYNQAYPKFDKILKGFNEIFSKEKLNDRDKVYFIITFVQNIEYKRPGGKLDLLPPIPTLASKYGDCDTKALLLYVLLERIGVDCVMFWSYQYKHAMLGVAGTGRGNFKLHKGKNYYFIETTYPGWTIGDISPDMDDLNYWYVDDLDSDIKSNSNENKEMQLNEKSEQNYNRSNKPTPSKRD